MKTNQTPKTLTINPAKKFICICAYCLGVDEKAKEKLRKYNKKWSDKGYSLSHGLCTECAKIYFK